MIQTALVVLGIQGRSPVKLRQVVSAKWISPVAPDESLEFVLRMQDAEAGGQQVKVAVLRRAERTAEFILEVTGQHVGARVT